MAYDDVRFVVKVEEGGFTPLLFAARSGDVASAELLLAAGAKVDDPAPTGATPLVVAAHSGNGDVAALLLWSAAPIRTPPAPDIRRCTRPSCEATSGVVEALVARGAKVDAPLERGTPVRRYSQDFAFSADLIGATPFWLAARYGDVPIMRALAEAGADTRRRHAGWIECADRRRGGVLGVRLRRSPRSLSDARGDRREGGEPTTSASRSRRPSLRLRSAPTSITRTATATRRCIWPQARVSSTVVQFLVEYGAALDVKNKRGLTPLGIALQRPRGEGGVTTPDDRREAAAAVPSQAGRARVVDLARCSVVDQARTRRMAG